MRLEELLSQRFRMELAPISTADSMYGALQLHPIVARVRRGISTGEIAEQDIADFVAAATARFQKGVRFSHDVELAALATALATVPTRFAERFLSELAAVEVMEMPLSPKIASLALTDSSARFTRNSLQKTLVFDSGVQPTMGKGVIRVSTPVPLTPERRYAA